AWADGKEFRSATVSQDGKTLIAQVTSGDIDLKWKVFDLPEGKPRSTATEVPGFDGHLVLSPDNRMLVSNALLEGRLTLTDIQETRRRRSWTPKAANMRPAFSPDSLLLAVLCGEGKPYTLKLFDTRSAAEVRNIAGDFSGYRSGSLGFSPDGKLL